MGIFKYIKDYFSIPVLHFTEFYQVPESIPPYIDNHLRPIIKNFEDKAIGNFRIYHSIQMFIISISAIPIVNLIDIGDLNYLIRIFSALFGSMIVVATGYIQLDKSNEKYILFRTATVNIQREYQLFVNEINEYDNKGSTN